MADIVPINAFKKDNNVELLSVRCLGVNDSRGHYFFLFSVIIKITLLPLMLYRQNFLSGGSVFYNACQLSYAYLLRLVPIVLLVLNSRCACIKLPFPVPWHSKP